jgi:hypothetical protein
VRILAGVSVQQPSDGGQLWRLGARIVSRRASDVLKLEHEIALYEGPNQFFGFGPWEMALTRIPCFDEWLMFGVQPSSTALVRQVRRVSTSGVVSEPVTMIAAAALPLDLAVDDRRCTDRDPRVAVGYYADGVGARLRFLEVTRTSGAIAQRGSDVVLPDSFAGTFAAVGGRWFGALVIDGAAAAYEIAGDGNGSSLTPIPLFGSGDANPGNLKGDLGEFYSIPGTAALIGTGRAVVVALPRGDGSASNLDSLRSTRARFDLGEKAAAVAYRIACE